MDLYKNEINRYQTLNQFAVKGGIAILGGSADLNIPVGELKESFGLNANIYNRSVANLKLSDAASVYDACVASLAPSTVALRLGEADVELFEKNSDEFVRLYSETIAHIRSLDSKIEIAIVALDNSNNSAAVDAMNKRLEALAESERCEYENVNDFAFGANAKGSASFVYSTGFVSQLSSHLPMRRLAKILYGYADSVKPCSAREENNRHGSRFVSSMTASLF